MPENFTVPPAVDQEYLDFVGRQSFVVDPRAQGYGLSDFDFLDGYANKFFLLAGSEGTFVSPREVPGYLLSYYHDLGIETAALENIHTIDPESRGALTTDVLLADHAASQVLAGRQGTILFLI